MFLVLFNFVIDSGGFSQANSKLQRNREHSSINLACQVNKKPSVFSQIKLVILQAPEGEGSRTYTSTWEDSDIDYVNQIPNPEYVNEIPSPEYVNV